MQDGGSNIATGSTSSGVKVEGNDQYYRREVLMPVANIIRIMRRALPGHAKISDDSKEAIQLCVSEFVMFVTSEANDRCIADHRNTVTADDLIWAMTKLGFDSYAHALSLFIRRYRQADPRRNHHVPAPPRVNNAPPPPRVADVTRWLDMEE